MRVESITLVVLVLCIFLSFYFAYLSFQTADDFLKKQLVFFAASSLIVCVVIFACMAIYIGIRKAFSHVGEQVANSEESLGNEDT